MGRIFREQMSSPRLYDCSQCGTNLSSVDWLVDPDYVEALEPAFLLSRVINVVHGPLVQYNLATGFEFLRDVHCKVCNTRLGWFYEYTQNNEDRYKEGKTVLELSKFNEVDGLPSECADTIVDDT